MKKSSCLIVLAASLSSTAWAACNYPAKPAKLPDGNAATREEMVAGKKVVETYNAEMNAYLACIKGEYDDNLAKQAASLTEEQKQQMAKLYTAKNDAAVDELQGVAGQFNEQLRVFKAKTAK
jgi:hypothetical protein